MDEKSLKRFEKLSTEELPQPSSDSEIDRLWLITSSEDFEVDMDDAWTRLSKELSTTARRDSNVFLKIAASIAVLITLTWIGYSQYTKSESLQFQAVDKTEEFRLPDNSLAILEKGSAISYVQSAQGRSLVLKGSAFFDVKKDADSPFIISSGPLTVEVIGTSFEVIGSENAYKLAVAEGEVQVSYGSNTWTLEKGNALSINTDSKTFKEYNQLNQVTTQWQTGKLVVENQNLYNILDMLAYRHDLNVKFKSSKLKSCLISGQLDLSKLEQTLEQLSATLDFSFELTENNLLISGEGC